MPLSKIEVPTGQNAKSQQEDAPRKRSASNFAPRQLSLRENVIFGLKLFLIATAVLGLLWLLDRLVTP